MQGAATIAPPICGRLESVEWECGAVALGRACLLPPLSSGSALAFPFMLGLRSSCWGGSGLRGPEPGCIGSRRLLPHDRASDKADCRAYAKLESTADPRLAEP